MQEIFKISQNAQLAEKAAQWFHVYSPTMTRFMKDTVGSFSA